jgi:hypothetical protein
MYVQKNINRYGINVFLSNCFCRREAWCRCIHLKATGHSLNYRYYVDSENYIKIGSETESVGDEMDAP